MPPTDEKIIRIGAKPDEAGFRSAQRLIRDMRLEAERLNQALGAMGRGILGGGAQVGPSGQARMPTAAQASSPVVTLSKQLLDSKQLFQSIATGSKQALQTMTQALRTESTAQTQLVGRLRREVESLSSSYRHLDDLRGRGVQLADPDAPGRVRGQLFQASANLSAAETLGGKLHQRHLQMVAAGGGGGSKWGARAQLAVGELDSAAGNWASKIGLGPNVMQFGGAAVIGAVIGKTLVNSLRSGMQEAQQAPWDFLGRSQMQSGWGREAMAMKGGDLTLMGAHRMVQNNPELARSFADLARGGASAPSGFERSASGGFSFNAEGYRRMQVGWEGFKQTMRLDPVGALNQGNRAINSMSSSMTQDQLRFLQTVRDANPLFFEAQHQFQQNAAGDVSAMRGLGMGPRGMRVRLDEMDPTKTTVSAGGNPALRLLRSYGNRGVGRGEVLSAMQGIEGVAGLGAAHRYLDQAIRGNLGHLPGAAGIAGQAALVGSGDFFPAVTNLVGRGSGGLDVTAAGMLGGTVAGTLANGAAPTSGLGLLGAVGAYARGGSGAEDVLNARFAGQGLGAIGSMLGGRTDPYQQGVNILSAIRSAPGASVGAQEYLARIDPRVLFDVVGGGEVPLELSRRGISADMVREHARRVFSRTYDRAISPTPNQGGRLNGVQGQTRDVQDLYSGSFQRYVREQSASLSGRDREDFLRSAFVDRGAFLTEVGLAGSDLEGQSFARLEAGLGRRASGRPQAGRGIGDPAGSSDELALEAKKSQFEGELERDREAMSPMLRADIANANKGVAVMAQTASEIGTSAKDVAQALDGLTSAIRDAEQRIRSGRAGGRAGPPR